MSYGTISILTTLVVGWYTYTTAKGAPQIWSGIAGVVAAVTAQASDFLVSQFLDFHPGKTHYHHYNTWIIVASAVTVVVLLLGTLVRSRQATGYSAALESDTDQRIEGLARVTATGLVIVQLVPHVGILIRFIRHLFK